MRWVPACILLVLSTAALAAADVRFVRVWPEWRDAAAFDRIGEYFGRPENGGREFVLRTQADSRDGMYFLVRVRTSAAVPAARFVLDVIRPDSPDARRFAFPVSLPGRGRVFQLGLTGHDWPGGRDVHPVAWKLTLEDASGHALAAEQSFLWAQPAP